jgi:hypothetical protein
VHPGGPALPSLPPPPRRALSAWPLLLVASVAALPAHARAQDDDELEIPTEAKANDQNPPVVKRFVPGIVMPGKVTLRVRIADDSPLLVATLYWRPNAGRSWQAIPLESQSRGLYSAQIDVEGDFQYWVEAFDVLGNGPGLDGAADRPYDVEVQRPRASEPLPVENPPARDETPPTLGEKPPAPELPLSSPPPPPRPPPSPKPLPPAEPPPPPILLSRVARVSTAQPATAGRLQFSLDGSYFNGTDFLVPGTTLLGGAGAVRLAWAPHALVELSASTSGRGAVLGTERPRRSTLLTAIGDSALGLRGVLPSVPALGPLRLAAEVNVELHTPFQGDARGVAASTTALLAATVEQGGLRTHLQAGYRWDNTENLLGGTWSDFPTFALGLSRFDALGFGVAVEAPRDLRAVRRVRDRTPGGAPLLWHLRPDPVRRPGPLPCEDVADPPARGRRRPPRARGQGGPRRCGGVFLHSCRERPVEPRLRSSTRARRPRSATAVRRTARPRLAARGSSCAPTVARCGRSPRVRR